MKLREYQQRGSDLVMDAWKEVVSTMVVLPTGAGKTILFADIIHRTQPSRTLVVAHRSELIFQAREKIMAYSGLDCEIEMAELSASTSLFHNCPVVIATIQTMNTDAGDRKRMGRFKPTDFSTLIIDECFPGNVTVDGKYICNVKEGDFVMSVGRTFELHRVNHVMKRKVDSLMKITFASGRDVVCTPNHPFWIGGGFCPASLLDKGDMVLRIRHAYEAHVSHTQEDVSHTQGDEPPTTGPGWEWATANSAREDIKKCAVMEEQSGHTYTDASPELLSNLLQGGRWPSFIEDSGGNRWRLAFVDSPSGFGPEEAGVFGVDWVDRVEVLEPGCDGTFRGMCPDGHVYNLEVDGTNNYFANGVLVHNCHHATAQSYRNLIHYFKQNPDLRVLGVTATPDRTDEEALGQIFDSVAFDYEILDAIEDGWLVPVEQQFVSVEGLDFSAIRTTAGDLNGSDLAAVMEAEKNLHGVASSTIEIIGHRRAIVFTASVKQAEILSDIFNRHRTGMADWVCGMTDKEQRRKILSSFSTGQTQVVCNCAVLTEGFDDAGVEVIIMANPTKSRSKYAQECGRAMRPLPGLVDGLASKEERHAAIAASKKPCCLIVDLVGNSGRHKLITSADILGGNVSEVAIEMAIKKAKKEGKAMRMVDLLEEAEDEIKQKVEERRRKDSERLNRIVGKAQYKTRFVNPFDALDITPARERGWDHGKHLSEKQSSLLLKQGINPQELNYSAAKQLISEMFRRWNGKLATFKQCSVLKRYGYETKDMTMQQASSLLNQLASNNWRRPEPKGNPVTKG